MKTTYTFENPDGTRSLLDLLVEQGAYVHAPCGGNGTCKKCTVAVNGETVLSCKMFPKETVTVELNADTEDDMEILAQGITREDFVPDEETRKYGVAVVDIGTTTIIGVLVDIRTGVILNTASCVNHQRAYGADVIARIQASVSGKQEALRRSICKDLADIVQRLNAKEQVVVLTGNTTMMHLLLGYDCTGLSAAPYTPVDLSLKAVDLPVFADGSCLTALILPGISAYVGADIVCGIYAMNMHNSELINILIDLGTNGEIVIGNKDRLICASTSAGPAFEGGNISCGISGVPGAISRCAIRSKAQAGEIEALIAAGRLTYSLEAGDYVVGCKTIGDRTPRGICGSGLIDIIAELYRNELIDEMGALDDEFSDDGFPVGVGEQGELRLLARDISQFQMAKSAVRAGIETALTIYGAKHSDINGVFIAGGFGAKLDVNSCCAIGLLPEDLHPDTVSVGNAALLGALAVPEEYSEEVHKQYENCAVRDLTLDDLRRYNPAVRKMEEIASAAEVVDLPKDRHFNDYFTDYLMFDE